MLIATLIALIVKLADAEIIIPNFVLSIFTMLGAMTLPLIMIIIGGNIYVDFHNKGKIYLAEIIKFVSIKI